MSGSATARTRRPAPPRFRRYHELMPNRVREVLLVSPRYHAYVLQQDASLTEQVFFEYRDLDLSNAPRFTHVTTGAAALDMMRWRRFDLVLVVTRPPDMEVTAFGRAVKQLRPGRPVVLLTFDQPDANRFAELVSPDCLDGVFVWSGDVKILLAIIKYVEDRANADNDIEVADVRVILLAEHSPRDVASLLSTLYPALMKQSQALFSEGLNRLQRLMRMRTRPKVLVAWSEDEAYALFQRYRDNFLAALCSTTLPNHEGLDPSAGLRFAHHVRAWADDLPLVLLSDDRANAEPAGALQARFLSKRSPRLFEAVREFLASDLGFGDFVFRLPDGTVIDRAANIAELEARIRTIPGPSLEYHARRNHISNWLMARSEFDVARRLKPRQVSDFQGIEDVRSYVLAAIEDLQREARAGVITDASPRSFDPESHFQRLGDGSVGGKARGIAFLDQLLSDSAEGGEIAGLPVRIPQTVVLTTEAFDDFIASNDLDDLVREPPDDDDEITRRFLEARLPRWVAQALGTLVDNIAHPLAVRSSSLLEDDLRHPFAGIYSTVMLANVEADRGTRLRELRLAVKTVYASTFLRNARAYVRNTSRRTEEEKMGVVIQRLVGQRNGDRFYPHFSGVAQSYNYYPIAPQQPEDGVAQMVLGLGRMVVEGGRVVRFSPSHPKMNMQMVAPKDFLKESQSQFFALDLDRPLDQLDPSIDDNTRAFPLAVAKDDGVLKAVGSIYDGNADAIVENPNGEGPWVVTFNNILQHEAIPLADALAEILDMTTEAMGMPVEIEFACDMGDWGRRLRRGVERQPPVLHLLQLRPLAVWGGDVDLERDRPVDARTLCQSSRTLGNGHYREVRDIVYVVPDGFDPAETRAIAQEVGALNNQLLEEGRPYMLIGPGRWGTSDPWLGVPVEWGQICGARILVEASPAGYHVDPSQGTHFFQNITSLGIGYLTIPPGATRAEPAEDGFVDWAWLAAQPALAETAHLRHIRLPEPLWIALDGRQSQGIVAR